MKGTLEEELWFLLSRAKPCWSCCRYLPNDKASRLLHQPARNPSISSTNVDSKSCITFLTSSSMTCIHLRTSDTILYSSPNPQKSRNCCVFTASHTVHHRLLSQWRLQFDWPSFPHPIGHSYSFCYRPIVNPVAYSAYFQQLINTMKALRKPHRNSNTIAP